MEQHRRFPGRAARPRLPLRDVHHISDLCRIPHFACALGMQGASRKVMQLPGKRTHLPHDPKVFS